MCLRLFSKILMKSFLIFIFLMTHKGIVCNLGTKCGASFRSTHDEEVNCISQQKRCQQ